MFTDLANDKNTTVGRHPEDFKLVRLGEFDDIEGTLFGSDKTSLGFATDYIKGESPVQIPSLSRKVS